MKPLVHIVAVLCLTALIHPPAAGEPVPPEAVGALVRRGAILPLAEVLRRNLSGGAHVMEASLELTGGHYLYKIKALGPDGIYRTYVLDAATGASAEGSDAPRQPSGREREDGCSGG